MACEDEDEVGEPAGFQPQSSRQTVPGGPTRREATRTSGRPSRMALSLATRCAATSARRQVRGDKCAA